MSEQEPAEAALADVLLAAGLFAWEPHKYGGIVLRGFGPARDRVVAELVKALSARMSVIKLPANADSEQLLGGLDLTATLAKGAPVQRAGIVERAAGGVVIVSMAERLSPNVAAHLAQAIDRQDLSIILLDDGLERDEAPPAGMMERCAFHCDVSGARSLDFALRICGQTQARARPLLKRQRSAIAAAAAAIGVHSLRPVLFAEQCARGLAACDGAERVGASHLETAMRLVLAPRALHLPAEQQSAPPPPQEPQSDSETESPEDSGKRDIPLDDLLLAATQAAIPKHVLDGIASGTLRASGGQAGRSGQKEKSAKRGRPRGSIAGMPGDGRKLALIDTLRAAAPWQAVRHGASGRNDQRLHIRKSDLRVRRFEQNRESLTIFAVDASGSSALSRLAEAKGAVELMLAEAHVKRSQVALIAFRQTGAEVLLPPTRSLTRARRALSGLPGGGGTPLAAGLLEARLLADAAEKRGQTPTIAVLTDGKANVTLAGEADRVTAMKEVEEVAKGIAGAGHHAIVIDIAPRPREEAAELAAKLRGKYLPLPHANSAAMVSAIESVSEPA
ncbi:magnesium chelatase subunit D [Erythrobacter sp. W53]|uniref:magnesium chelatase subunit D n=1 Tax=Erythrobacter sp. W53 TaxID=3425947 RepID=UPI003D767E0C